MTTFLFVYLTASIISNIVLLLITKSSKGMRDFWVMKRKDALAFFGVSLIPLVNVLFAVFLLIMLCIMIVEKINTSKFWDENV